MTIKLPEDLQPKSQKEREIAEMTIKRISTMKPFRSSQKLTAYHIKLGRHLIGLGYRQHDIAAAMEVNQGRLSEAKNNRQ